MNSVRLLAGVLFALVLAANIAGCAPSQAAPAAPAVVPASASGSPLAGITPSTDLTGASDANGAAAIGATDSGPSRGPASAAPEQTGGDGTGARP